MLAKEKKTTTSFIHTCARPKQVKRFTGLRVAADLEVTGLRRVKVRRRSGAEKWRGYFDDGVIVRDGRDPG